MHEFSNIALVISPRLITGPLGRHPDLGLMKMAVPKRHALIDNYTENLTPLRVQVGKI